MEKIRKVALRKESVDRNVQQALKMMKNTEVALRKESVDRNVIGDVMGKALAESLSARRAWIEMSGHRQAHTSPTVALRKESVDRNVHVIVHSAHPHKVALRKESVDRNVFVYGS